MSTEHWNKKVEIKNWDNSKKNWNKKLESNRKSNSDRG